MAATQAGQGARWLPDLLLNGIFVASLLISAAFILRDSGIVPAFPMDQHFAATVDLRIMRSGDSWQFHYPALQNSGGITASLIAGIYKLIIPTTEGSLNWHIRILGMVAYLGSSFALIRTFIPYAWERVLGLLLIATSGFQFIQPTSELFAGCLLTLYLLSVFSRWPVAISSLFLAGFGLCKVEMTIAALCMTLFWCLWEWRKGGTLQRPAQILVWTFVWLLLLLAPTFVVSGSNPLSGNRSYIAFLSAYGEFFSVHQWAGTGSPGLGGAIEQSRQTLFRDADSFLDIVRNHPRQYFDFVGVSAVRSLPNLVHALKAMIIPLGFVAFQHTRLAKLRLSFYLLCIACLLTLVPAWLVIYIRLRYVIKLFPALIAITIGGTILLHEARQRTMTATRPLLWSCAAMTIVWQLYFFTNMAKFSHWK